jgi:uncharacterized DUF497 family protein
MNPPRRGGATPSVTSIAVHAIALAFGESLYPTPLFRGTLCIYTVRYEWDERKNRQNQRKHVGISFELAVLVFDDERRLTAKDRVDETGEQRWHAIGAVSVEPGIADLLLVVHVYREDEDGEEIIRIVSARRADKNDYRRYQEQEMD